MADIRYTDPEKNRFAKTNIAFETNPLLLSQDPVVVGFKLMFSFHSPLLNTDPDNVNTALSYLKSIGEEERAAYLERFIEMLKFLQNDMAWYFQTIEGLDEAWKRDFASPKVHGELTIGCLEDVSFKMTALIDLYRKACFDWGNTREIVPKNLRKFDLYVFVFDGRIITEKPDYTEPTQPEQESLKSRIRNSVTEAFGGKQSNFDEVMKSGQASNTNDKTIAYDEQTRVLFEFHKCQFNLESGSGFFSSLSNAEYTAPGQSLKIEYHGVSEANLYKILGDGKVADIVTGQLILSALDISSKSADTGTSGQEQVQKGWLGKLGDTLKGKPRVKNLIAKANDIASIDPVATAANLGKGLVNNAIESAGAKVLGAVLDAIGADSASITNATEDLPQGVRNANDASGSLTNVTEKPNGNVSDINNSPSLGNKTDQAGGNVYE